MSITARRLVRGTVVLGAAAMLATAAPATADESKPPNCTAADLAGVLPGVAAGMSVYLFTHPDVNAFYTTLNGMPRDQQRDALQTFLDAHPQEEAELRAIRQPALDFRDRCEIGP
jgi:hemophore-related protein